MVEAVAEQLDGHIESPIDSTGSPSGTSSGTSSGTARWRPRITHEPAPVDLVKAEKAATEMLAALGLPIDSADMFETPRRLVHAYAEMLTPPEFDSTTFENAAGYDELVLVTD